MSVPIEAWVFIGVAAVLSVFFFEHGVSRGFAGTLVTSIAENRAGEEITTLYVGDVFRSAFDPQVESFT